MTTNGGVRLLGLLGRGGVPGADGPDRLVGQHHLRQRGRVQPGKAGRHLAEEHLFGPLFLGPSRVSPTHRITCNPAARAPRSFWLTTASVSPMPCRRSPWPMITDWQPTSRSMGGADLAGEAPLGWLWQSTPPGRPCCPPPPRPRGSGRGRADRGRPRRGAPLAETLDDPGRPAAGRLARGVHLPVAGYDSRSHGGGSWRVARPSPTGPPAHGDEAGWERGLQKLLPIKSASLRRSLTRAAYCPGRAPGAVGQRFLRTRVDLDVNAVGPGGQRGAGHDGIRSGRPVAGSDRL